MRDCVHCRDWGKYEKHEEHWPPPQLETKVDAPRPWECVAPQTCARYGECRALTACTPDRSPLPARDIPSRESRA